MAFAPLTTYAVASDHNTENKNQPLIPSASETIFGNPEIKNTLTQIEGLVTELGQADESTNPKKSSDTFRLAGQTFQIQTDGSKAVEFALDDININLPTVGFEVAKLEVEIDRENHTLALKTESTDGELYGFLSLLAPQKLINKARQYKVLNYIIGKKNTVRHVFKGLDIVSHARDGELLILVDSSGKIYAIDMGYIAVAGFKNSVPVFPVGEISQNFNLNQPTKTTFLTRGLKPFPAENMYLDPQATIPLDREKAIFSAGDAVIYQEINGRRNLVGIYDRQVMMSYVLIGTLLLTWQAYAIMPSEHNASVESGLIALLKDPAFAKAALAQNLETNEINPHVVKALSGISTVTIQKLLLRIKTIQASTQDLKDRFVIGEWEKSFTKLLAQSEKTKLIKDAPAVNPNDLGPQWKELTKNMLKEQEAIKSTFYRVMHSKAMKLIAALAIGGAAAAGATYLLGDSGPAWAVTISNKLFEALPEVLKVSGQDGYPAYRITLMKSLLSMGSFVVVAWTIGALTARNTGWTFRKQLGALGTRSYAFFQLPFFHRVASMTGQPNFLRALGTGANPLAKIKPSSPIGQKLNLQEGLRLGLINPFAKDRAEKAALQNQALSQMARQRANAKIVAGLVANMVVSEQFQIDLPTMLVVQGEKHEADKSALAIISDKKFHQQWAIVAAEVTNQILNSSKAQGLDFSQLTDEELKQYILMADETANEVRTFANKHPKLTQLRARFNGFGAKMLKGTANFGLAENAFLRTVEPNEFVQNQFWRRFVLEYLLTITQEGLIGKRADLSNKGALAADPNGVLWTGEKQLGDKMNMLRSQLMNPAALTMVYQPPGSVSEGNYSPIETMTLKTAIHPESLIEGGRTLFKEVTNLPKADYPSIFLRSIFSRLKTFQAPMIFMVSTRMVLGGDSTVDAFRLFAVYTIWSQWAYVFVLHIVDRGSQMYEQKFAGPNKRFELAQVKLSQGLNLKDDRLAQDGFQELVELYENTEKLPQEISDTLKSSEEIFKSSPEEREVALQELLEYTKLNAPFKNAPSRLVSNIFVILGSLTATYLSGALFVSGASMPLIPLFFTSATMYTTSYFTQKLIINKIPEWRRKRAEAKTASASTLQSEKCKSLFSRLFK